MRIETLDVIQIFLAKSLYYKYVPNTYMYMNNFLAEGNISLDQKSSGAVDIMLFQISNNLPVVEPQTRLPMYTVKTPKSYDYVNKMFL